MDRILDPLEKYLLYRLLIIDTDQSEVDLLVRIVSTPAGTLEKTSCDTVVVATLTEAEAYIERQMPIIAVIDPAIDSTSNILDFIASVRDAYPNVVWLINTTDHWWRINAQALQSHPFGPRLKRYYQRIKRPSDV